jgi:predicted dehydrogenase
MSAKNKRKKAKRYTAVVIGAGRIGATFDSPKSKEILTHCHAFTAHPDIELVGVCDERPGVAEAAGKRWNTPWFDHVGDMLTTLQPDIVSVCIYTDQHAALLRRIAKFRPKLVICEKPVTNSMNETKKIIREYKRLGIPVLVNHSRRFDVDLANIQNNFRKGKYGKAISASMLYTHGVLNNGSHVLDVAHWFFGEAQKIRPLHTHVDGLKNDPSVDAHLVFEKCPSFSLMSGDEREYSIIEFDVLCEKARIRFADFGAPPIAIQIPGPDPIYKGYRTLPLAKTVESAGHTRNMYNMAEHAVRYLSKKEALRCTMQDSLKTQELCLTLAKKARSLKP